VDPACDSATVQRLEVVDTKRPGFRFDGSYVGFSHGGGVGDIVAEQMPSELGSLSEHFEPGYMHGMVLEYRNGPRRGHHFRIGHLPQRLFLNCMVVPIDTYPPVIVVCRVGARAIPRHQNGSAGWYRGSAAQARRLLPFSIVGRPDEACQNEWPQDRKVPPTAPCHGGLLFLHWYKATGEGEATEVIDRRMVDGQR